MGMETMLRHLKLILSIYYTGRQNKRLSEMLAFKVRNMKKLQNKALVQKKQQYANK